MVRVSLQSVENGLICSKDIAISLDQIPTNYNYTNADYSAITKPILIKFFSAQLRYKTYPPYQFHSYWCGNFL